MLYKICTVVLLALLMSFQTYAQRNSNCGDTFESITLGCIKSQQKKLDAYEASQKKKQVYYEKAVKGLKGFEIKKAELQKDLVLILKNLEEARKIKNNIYVYQSSANIYGKFLIKDVFLTNNSCSLLVESLAYRSKEVINKTMTIAIENTTSSWNTDRVSFDNNGTSNFMLKREHGICVLKRVTGKVALLKKMPLPPENEGNLIILYAGYFAIGLSAFLIARTVFQDEDKYKAQEKLEIADDSSDDKKNTPNDIVLKYSRPFFKRYISPVVQGMKKKRIIREKYKRPLASSGMNKFLTPEDFYAFKLFLILGFPLVFLGLRVFLEEDWPLIYLPIISIGGFLYPDFWIKGKTEQRRQEVLENMPFVVDMLALSVEAGLDFVAAMQKVIEKAPDSALVEEFETMIKETKIGASRAEGLRQMSWRIDALPMSSFCATLIAADSVGANISPILKTLAQELRQKRSSVIEQKGAQAATKILIPMIFFVLPATLIVIMAPIVLQLMGVS